VSNIIVRVVHGLGQPTGWVGLDWVGSSFFYFWWVGLGRGSETAETQKLKFFIRAEFIDATNVVDVDGHGKSRKCDIVCRKLSFLYQKVCCCLYGIGWVVGWVGLGPGSKFLLWCGLGWVEQISSTDNSD